ncbi:hypothetical protein [Legionella yabuuchiae]|uniref:hypothetical protein n=1 Tax=Legionella yabuuchiae TaxID=376727 RepID=UPI001054FAFA|nr:hypothetical protein [Legionella yabuuchiae]
MLSSQIKFQENPSEMLVSTNPQATSASEINHYDVLTHSLPKEEHDKIIEELSYEKIIKLAELLCEQLSRNEQDVLDQDKSRDLFLAALKNLKLNKITAGQLATLHVLDSAIHTLYTNPLVYLIHKFVDANGEVARTTNIFAINNPRGMPTSVKKLRYNMVLPEGVTVISGLPVQMQKPLMQRFFNFTDSEWRIFCQEMDDAPVSEQWFSVLIAPDEGCYSSIITKIQKALKCMRALEWVVNSKDGFQTENIMLVPSFSMFQSALKAKAWALGRKPIKLIPTYGYIEPKHYADLKASGNIAFAMYMPETDPLQRYRNDSGRFRTTIDGHPSETAFAGAIHDVYHAMREISMSENVARARWRLVSIARNHPHNQLTPSSRPVDDILVDGELIYSFPPAIDTMFEPDFRPNCAELFGDIFYKTTLKPFLHEDLKRAFITDMVVNEGLWQSQFNIGRPDLRKQDQDIFDAIKIEQSQSSNVISFSAAQAMRKIGFLAHDSSADSSSSVANFSPNSTDASILP